MVFPSSSAAVVDLELGAIAAVKTTAQAQPAATPENDEEEVPFGRVCSVRATHISTLTQPFLRMVTDLDHRH